MTPLDNKVDIITPKIIGDQSVWTVVKVVLGVLAVSGIFAMLVGVVLAYHPSNIAYYDPEIPGDLSSIKMVFSYLSTEKVVLGTCVTFGGMAALGTGAIFLPVCKQAYQLSTTRPEDCFENKDLLTPHEQLMQEVKDISVVALTVLTVVGVIALTALVIKMQLDANNTNDVHITDSEVIEKLQGIADRRGWGSWKEALPGFEWGDTGEYRWCEHHDATHIFASIHVVSSGTYGLNIGVLGIAGGVVMGSSVGFSANCINCNYFYKSLLRQRQWRLSSELKRRDLPPLPCLKVMMLTAPTPERLHEIFSPLSVGALRSMVKAEGVTAEEARTIYEKIYRYQIECNIAPALDSHLFPDLNRFTTDFL